MIDFLQLLFKFLLYFLLFFTHKAVESVGPKTMGRWGGQTEHPTQKEKSNSSGNFKQVTLLTGDP